MERMTALSQLPNLRQFLLFIVAVALPEVASPNPFRLRNRPLSKKFYNE